MKKRMFIILVVLTILAPQACAQRKVVSDYNYRKAVEAYFQDDDDDKALELLNKQIDDTPNHIDSRFIRARIYWSTDKGALGLRSQYTFKGSNYTGFSLVGAGYRYSEGSTGFEGRLGIAAWFYPNEIEETGKLYPSAGYAYDNDDYHLPDNVRADSKLWGLSIRCVMANQE